MCKRIKLTAIDRNKKVTWAKLQGPGGNHVLFKYYNISATFTIIVVFCIIIFPVT